MYIRYRISLLIIHTLTQSAHKSPVDTLNVCREAALQKLSRAQEIRRRLIESAELAVGKPTISSQFIWDRKLVLLYILSDDT